MNVGDRVIFHDNCKHSVCGSCGHDGQEGVVKTSANGEAVVEFPDGFSTWAGTNELEAVTP